MLAMSSNGIPLVVPIRVSGVISMQTTTSRIDAEGLFVRSLICPKEGSRVSLALALPGSVRLLKAKGTVASRGEASPKDAGFWVRFDEVSGDARALIEVLQRRRSTKGLGPAATRNGKDNRAYARVPARFRVGWVSEREFLAAYSDNISRGGIFVATDQPPALREVVELSVELPDGKPPVTTQAEVVHRVTPEEARASGRVAGAGLQFIGGSDEFRRRLDACIEELAG